MYPVHLLIIPMYICTSQSLFSHVYVVNEWLNRHCNLQIDIWVRADELGIAIGRKLEDFEFRAAFTIIQHFHFFEKKNLKNAKEIQNILQKIRNGGIKFLKWHTYALALNMFLFLFRFFRFFSKKCKCWTIVNAARNLKSSNFQPNTVSFCQAIIFSWMMSITGGR
jgi:hypothetical protein